MCHVTYKCSKLVATAYLWTRDVSFRNWIESTINMSFLSKRKLFRESFTGVGQQVEHPHSPKHHYTVYAGSRHLKFVFIGIRLKTCIVDIYMSTYVLSDIYMLKVASDSIFMEQGMYLSDI